MCLISTCFFLLLAKGLIESGLVKRAVARARNSQHAMQHQSLVPSQDVSESSRRYALISKRQPATYHLYVNSCFFFVRGSWSTFFSVL
jgi:hypothetical protein